jgi:pimeloyl-ACP methyl ester carboxylesterase
MATLNVPGGELYYEVRGSGPVLLMIPGGPMDAGGFAPLAEEMAPDYTVLTYDCRGNSRSAHNGDTKDLTVELHADDARRLLDALSAEPALVLGSSGGAMYGLDLVARHPGRVKTLVVHEPPVMMLLPDADRWRAFNESIRETFEKEGVFPAMQRFGEGVGLGGPPPEQDMTPEAMEVMTRTMGNMELFAGQLIPVVGNYTPDIDALRNSSTRIVVGVGEETTPEQIVTYHAPRALADQLGTEPVLFPGEHGGFGSHPEGFAKILREELSS